MSHGTLVTLSVVEILLLVAVLALFLLLLTRRLRQVVDSLARIAFGVRAVETQVGLVSPATTEVNERLAELTRAVAEAADRAEELAGR